MVSCFVGQVATVPLQGLFADRMYLDEILPLIDEQPRGISISFSTLACRSLCFLLLERGEADGDMQKAMLTK